MSSTPLPDNPQQNSGGERATASSLFASLEWNLKIISGILMVSEIFICQFLLMFLENKQITKICKFCGIEQPLSNFRLSKNIVGKLYYGNQCKDCKRMYNSNFHKLHPEIKRAREKRYYKLNPDKRIEGIKAWRIDHPTEVRMTRVANKYGMTRQQLQELLDTQKNCPICGRAFSDEVRPMVDHSHDTNTVRQLICARDNNLLGFCDERIEVLEGAIAYLKRWNGDDNVND
jgi:hypothetical protein